jgi:hypothetical protein
MLMMNLQGSSLTRNYSVTPKFYIALAIVYDITTAIVYHYCYYLLLLISYRYCYISSILLSSSKA